MTFCKLKFRFDVVACLDFISLLFKSGRLDKVFLSSSEIDCCFGAKELNLKSFIWTVCLVSSYLARFIWAVMYLFFVEVNGTSNVFD